MAETKTLSANINRIEQQLTAGRDRWTPLIPDGFTAERFQALMMNSIRQTPELLNCLPQSLFGALINSVKLGLNPDGLLGEAYLLPFGREVKLIVGYKGLIALAYRSGEVASFDAQVVYEGDDFDYELGFSANIKHKPSNSPQRTENQISHVYAWCERTNGARNVVVMTWDEIESHRRRFSKGGERSHSPWQTRPVQMAKKTALRSLINSGVIPLSADVKEALERDGETVTPLKYDELAELYDNGVDKQQNKEQISEATI